MKLNKKIISCKKCPRLAEYIKLVAKQKVKRFSSQSYWGKPLPGFGDVNAQLLLVGLAPAAHGGNRTGRMFTGDSSGDWLAKTLFENGFATKPSSIRIDDGFRLINTYVTATLRCAPPQNKPLREEILNCSEYLKNEFEILKNVRVIVCLGKIAFDSCKKILDLKNEKFSHGKMILKQPYKILCSYHPSKQNTQTGRLVWEQWNMIFKESRRIISE